MDESKLRELVTEHAQSLMQRLGIPHWTIDFYYNLRESNGRCTKKAECIRQVNYNKAAIDLDPSEFKDDDPTGNLRTLRHELFHVLLSPFDLFCNAAEELWKDDPVKQGVLNTVWNFAQEQAVINLERMYQGLTSNPAEEPAMGRQKTKAATTVPTPKAPKAPTPTAPGPKAPTPKTPAPAPKGTKAKGR